MGRPKECLINTDPVESTAKGSTYLGCQKIHLLSDNLPAGKYVIRINAEDKFNDRTSQAILGFELKAGEKGKAGKAEF